MEIDYSEDLDSLKRFIKIDEQILNVKWQLADAVTGKSYITGNDYSIVAVLNLGSKFREIVSSWRDEDCTDQLFLDKKFIKTWFPQAIANSFILDQRFETPTFKPIHGYKPNRFAKSPLLNGFYMKSEPYVLVHLFTQ